MSLDQVPHYSKGEIRILHYKNQRILHHQILKDFEQDLDREIIVNRATANQVIIYSDEKTPKGFQTTDDLESFLR